MTSRLRSAKATKQSTNTKDQGGSIVSLEQFIQATRDSGYKSTASAVSELVDNALQAKATRIQIQIAEKEGQPFLDLWVADNGSGMDPFTLRQALRFGGSSRFNDRTGLGRYGMGLPNSSLSQARRVAVFTWRAPDRVYSTYLDVDEISTGAIAAVPTPRRVKYPLDQRQSRTGTIVWWSRCDRLDAKRTATLARKLAPALGRRFRYFLWRGVSIVLNGQQIQPIDPLYLHEKSAATGASRFGEVLQYEVRADPSDETSETGTVRVTFSELPVHSWHKLSNKEKRLLGVSKGAGVSVVRAGREVDYGWLFLGGKRRENYDDWWRCEVQFDPVLDDAFGITHTKQQVRPKPYLIEALSADFEMTARALNARARKAHLAAKFAERFIESERLASERDVLLAPLPANASEQNRALVRMLKKEHPALRAAGQEGRASMRYSIVQAPVKDAAFYACAQDGGHLILALNPSHPFYKQVYQPLLESDVAREMQLRTQLELFLLALARTDATLSPAQRALTEQLRLRWSDTLATFLNG